MAAVIERQATATILGTDECRQFGIEAQGTNTTSIQFQRIGTHFQLQMRRLKSLKLTRKPISIRQQYDIVSLGNGLEIRDQPQSLLRIQRPFKHDRHHFFQRDRGRFSFPQERPRGGHEVLIRRNRPCRNLVAVRKPNRGGRLHRPRQPLSRTIKVDGTNLGPRKIPRGFPGQLQSVQRPGLQSPRADHTRQIGDRDHFGTVANPYGDESQPDGQPNRALHQLAISLVVCRIVRS